MQRSKAVSINNVHLSCRTSTAHETLRVRAIEGGNLRENAPFQGVLLISSMDDRYTMPPPPPPAGGSIQMPGDYGRMMRSPPPPPGRYHSPSPARRYRSRSPPPPHQYGGGDRYRSRSPPPPHYDGGYGGGRYRSRSPPRRYAGGGGSGYEQRRRPPAPVYRGTDEERARSTTLFVGNIPYGFDDRDVAGLFERFGRLRQVHVPIDRFTRRNKG